MYTFFKKKAVLSTTKYSTWIRDDVLQFKGQNLSLNKYLFFYQNSVNFNYKENIYIENVG